MVGYEKFGCLPLLYVVTVVRGLLKGRCDADGISVGKWGHVTGFVLDVLQGLEFFLGWIH